MLMVMLTVDEDDDGDDFNVDDNCKKYSFRVIHDLCMINTRETADGLALCNLPQFETYTP